MIDSPIFRAFAPIIAAITLMVSLFITLRGHNEPGGGFIGGLIAASAFALIGLSHGEAAVRRMIGVHPTSIAAFGLLIAGLAGIAPILAAKPLFTALWAFPSAFGVEIALSTPLVFDIGVYLVVAGSMTAIALALEQRGDGI